jgi:putative phosphoesterase
MRIAILSDSHDNVWKLEKAMNHLAMVDVILHCGNLISPFMLNKFIEGIKNKPIHLIWGNNDGDKRMLSEIALNSTNITIHGDFADFVIDKYKIAIVHYPNIAHALAETNKYDLVCYGHDHIAYESVLGKTLLINPGELMGMNTTSSIAILNTVSKDVDFIEII